MKNPQSQSEAMFLVVFGAVCIAVGCHFGWHELVSFATAFGGGGVGILRGQQLAQQVNQEQGTINVVPKG